MVDSEPTSVASLVEQYLAEPLIEFHRSNCYDWWRDNKARFPQLAKLAQQYLAALPTAISLEKVFSGASDLHDEKQNQKNRDSVVCQKQFQLESLNVSKMLMIKVQLY